MHLVRFHSSSGSVVFLSSPGTARGMSFHLHNSMVGEKNLPKIVTWIVIVQWCIVQVRRMFQAGWLIWTGHSMAMKEINFVWTPSVMFSEIKQQFLPQYVARSMFWNLHVAVSVSSKTLHLDFSWAHQTSQLTNCVSPDPLTDGNRRCVCGRCDLALCLCLSHFLCFPAFPFL